MNRRLALLLVILFTSISGLNYAQRPPEQSESWIDSPEALFATKDERREWMTLGSRDERDAFKQRYWLKRDPSPGTATNEFRDTILGRIRTANERFAITKTEGSATARGRAFVLFGTPAQSSEQRASPPPPPPPRGTITPRVAIGWEEGNESTVTWAYDRVRTPRLVEAIGRPSFEIRIILEPSRHRDRLQNPGLYNELREILANKSIVNSSLVPGTSTDGQRAELPLEPLPGGELSKQIRAALAAASPVSRSQNGVVFGTAIISSGSQPVTVAWFYVPASFRSLKQPKLVGIVAAEDREIGRISRAATPSEGFLSSAPGAVYVLRIPLQPGKYDAAFGLYDRNENISTHRVTLFVPRADSAFDASSLLITGGVVQAPADASGDFVLGGIQILPRADMSFTQQESLWYFFQVMNPKDPGQVTTEIRLRRGSEPVGSPSRFPAAGQRIAEGVYLSGFELPLSAIAPGDYTLYVTVRDGTALNAPEILRRTHFRVVAR